MTNVQENLGAQRTRRNIMKMGAILVGVSAVRPAAADTSFVSILRHDTVVSGLRRAR